MTTDDAYEPPRGRSFGRWLLLAVIALVVAAAMVIGALGGLGVFSPQPPAPTPTVPVRAASLGQG